MARPSIDYTGQKFNRLTFVKYLENRNGQSIWFLNCDCGNTSNAAANKVKNGTTKSCGCLHKENVGLMGSKNKSR
jgi:aminopeptidase C